MSIEFIPEGDMTVTRVNSLVGDPFDPAFDPATAWEVIPLPEPVHLKAGCRYESGFENGQPFIRELVDREGG